MVRCKEENWVLRQMAIISLIKHIRTILVGDVTREHVNALYSDNTDERSCGTLNIHKDRPHYVMPRSDKLDVCVMGRDYCISLLDRRSTVYI